MRLAPLFLLLSLAACASPGPTPDFAAKPFEPFNRIDTVAIALREWRLFGEPVDTPPGTSSLASNDEDRPHEKPERASGLWQRVGEYWWIGLGAGSAERSWTGKHDAQGHVFPPEIDGRYAWSAAFISYVMRIAGAGGRFPYAPNHATYVNAAAAGRSSILRARNPDDYAPQLGDLICHGRAGSSGLRFKDLPTNDLWPGHCAIVAMRDPARIGVIGGNVNDAVSMTHVPVQPDGRLFGPDDPRSGYPWFVVLQVLYDAEAEPVVDG